jgi:hypothetical protein
MRPAKDAAKDAAASFKKGLQRFRPKTSSSRPSTADSAWMGGRAQVHEQPQPRGTFGGSIGRQTRVQGSSVVAMMRRQSDFGDSRRVADERPRPREAPAQQQQGQVRDGSVGFRESNRMLPVASSGASTNDIIVSINTVLFLLLLSSSSVEPTLLVIVGCVSQTRRLRTVWSQLPWTELHTVTGVVVDPAFSGFARRLDGSFREVFGCCRRSRHCGER